MKISNKKSSLAEDYRSTGIDMANIHYVEDAEEMFKKAIELGNADATNDLGVLWQRQHKYDLALQAYKTSANQNRPTACCNAGCMYMDGKGVEVDYAIALNYFKRAVKLGSISAYSYIADMYRYGLGVEKDMSKAIKWLKKGEKHEGKNSEMCSMQLEYIYECVEFGYKNQRKCYKVCKKHASRRNSGSLYNLALCYLHGKGTKVNVNKGLNAMKMSANAGYFDAYYKLARYYREGEFVDKAIMISNYYLMLAIKSNSHMAVLWYCALMLEEKDEYLEFDKTEVEHELWAFNNKMRYDGSKEEWDKEWEYYDLLKKKFQDKIDWNLVETSKVDPLDIENQKYMEECELC